MVKTLLLCGVLIFAVPAYAEDVDPHLFDDLNANGISDSVEVKTESQQQAAEQTPAAAIPVDSSGNAVLVDIPEGGL